MKKTTILGISPTHKLIIAFDQGKTFVQAKFQGFQITNELTFRPQFDQLIGKQIQCSYNKNQKTLRYQNESFFTNLIRSGALTANQKELEDLRIYTQEQKTNFVQITVSQEFKDKSKTPILLNDKENLPILKNLIKERKSIKAQIEYLCDNLLVRFENEGRTVFLKCKIENCKQYFQLFPQVTFWKKKFLPLQTEIKIVSEKYNLLEKTSQIYVTIDEKILEHLFKQGWVALNQMNYNKNSRESFKKLATEQIESIKKNKGIYSSKSEILSFIYAKNNYVGVVTNVIEGYIYEIMALKTQEIRKIELPMVICPVGEDTGSFWSREFARKQLIGKEVNVYLHREGGLNITGNIVRIEDWKDIESVMLENGYAFVREEFRNSVLGQKYSVLEQKAKQKQKGLHKKDIGSRRFEDLTQAPVSKAQIDSYIQRRLQLLSKLSQNEEIVVQKIIRSSTYKIRIESMNILLNIRLEGVIEPQLNPNLNEYNEIKQTAEKFLDRNFFQRTMIASISDYDEESNCFIGTLLTENGKVDAQEILIKNSFVYADKNNFVSKYINLETETKKANKLIWQPQLLCFEPGFELDKEQYCFEGRFSWLHNGKIAYVQPKDSIATLEKLQQKIREGNLPKLPIEKVKIGAWCAAFYEGQLYRGLIKSKKDNNVTVEFFDWGNQQIVKIDTLKELPEELLYTQKQCIRVNLNLLGATRNKEAVEKVRDILFDGGIYVFKKVYGDLVDFFAGETSSVNEELICKGLLKADKDDLKRYENRQMIKNVQEELRKDRAGIWEESDSSDEETEHY